MRKYWSTSVAMDDELEKLVFKYAKSHKFANMSSAIRALIKRGLDAQIKDDAIRNTEELLRLTRHVQECTVKVYVDMMARLKPDVRQAVEEKAKSIISLFDQQGG